MRSSPVLVPRVHEAAHAQLASRIESGAGDAGDRSAPGELDEIAADVQAPNAGNRWCCRNGRGVQGRAERNVRRGQIYRVAGHADDRRGNLQAAREIEIRAAVELDSIAGLEVQGIDAGGTQQTHVHYADTVLPGCDCRRNRRVTSSVRGEVGYVSRCCNASNPRWRVSWYVAVPPATGVSPEPACACSVP